MIEDMPYLENSLAALVDEQGHILTSSDAIAEAIKRWKEGYEEAQKSGDTFWATIEKNQKSQEIKSKQSGGWKDEKAKISGYLDNGDGQGLVEWIKGLSKDMRNAMLTDMPWINDILALFKGDYTGAGIPLAIEIMNNNLKEAKTSATDLASITSDFVKSESYDKKKENGFVEEIAQMKALIDSGEYKSLAELVLGGFGGEFDSSQIKDLYENISGLAQLIQDIQDGADPEKIAEDVQLVTQSMTEATDTLYNLGKDQLESGLTSDQTIEAIGKLVSAFDTGGLEAFGEAWNKLDKKTQDYLEDSVDGVKEMSKAYNRYMNKIEDSTDDATKGIEKMSKASAKLEFEKLKNQGKVWKEVGDAIDGAGEAGTDFTDATGKLITKITKLNTVQSDLEILANESAKGTKAYANAQKEVQTNTGILVSDANSLALAQGWVADQTDIASNSMDFLLNTMISLIGLDLNTSNWQAELQRLADEGNVTAQEIIYLINWLSTLSGTSIGVKNGKISVTGLGKGGGGSSKSSGSSGSKNNSDNDRRSSSKSKEKTEIEKMIETMKAIQELYEHKQDMFQAAQDYYEQTGYTQGLIKYLGKEKDAIIANNDVLEENVKKLEESMKAQAEKVKAMNTADDAYETEKKDLDSLQELHQKYSLQLIKNKTDVEKLTQEIKDQQDAVRDMQIELRETIKKAIEDREELEERMLQGTINVQNEILDILKARYEKEQDMAVEAAEAKKDALEEEMDLLDEELEKRKQLSEEQDKQKELAELQAKLERISADPTRKKEELELREKIADLRDEMAWDTAQKEVDAQKKSIQQQIDSLDDYIDYVNNYYEELFENPQKLIAEMKEIMSRTDDEILAWLKENSEDYKASTEETQQDMVNSWNEMLMDMHGAIKDYWTEVEEIISKGDDAIIEFLKENSKDYKEAGKLQAEAYVDEWKKQLEDLRKACKEVNDEINSYEYTIAAPSTGSGSSGSSGSSSGSNKKKNNGSSPKTKCSICGSTSHNASYHDNSAHWGTSSSKKKSGTSGGEADSPLKAFASGGLATTTGIAWLDGTASKPERVLSPYQTELFDDMVASLHNLRVSMPKISGYGAQDIGGGNMQTTFGDINISVEKLEDDADYDEIAQKVMEVMEEMISKGSAVGGLRFTR